MPTWLIYTLCAMIFYFLGDVFSKLYANPGGQFWHAAAGVLAYSMTCVLWFPAIAARNEMCVIGMLWLAMYTTIGFVVAIGLFGERLNIHQIIGIVVILVGVIIMERA